MILAFRHAYEEPFWKSALKMLGVVTAYGAAILLVLLGLAALHPAA